MEAIASKEKNQPAPPHLVFDDLVSPNRQPSRPWLHLYDDEVAPTVLEAARPRRVVWSSLWTKRPDAQVVFDLSDGRSGTNLRWTLLIEQPAPDDRQLRHLCQRIGNLINANLRYTYGQ
ncbi:hypothetical protein [Gordonia sp. KTR9]|uniref:hypothetical protein n=1 Tax=Gordonia sp. KTR9 TaxID=337191 RepID=UPI00031675DE